MKNTKIIESLNNKQSEAVLNYQDNLLLIAGAGTGKTKTLVSKIIFLLENNIYNEYEILGLTFSNNAAKEMRKRINNYFNEEKTQLSLSTFHSLCVKILRIHADKIHYSRNFTIYDENESEQIMKKIIENDDEAPSLKKIMSYIEKIKSYGYYVGKKEKDKYKLLKPELHEYFVKYEEELLKNNAFDFNSLITMTIKLFEYNPEILSIYHNKIKYILIDEFQDTNFAQFELVSLLKSKNCIICACGDEDQLLFSWRHADIKIILNFDKFFNAKVIKLEQNYRSHQNILNVANHVIEKNILRKGKKLWTSKISSNKIMIKEYNSNLLEAINISNYIEQLKINGIDLNEIAILYRNNYQSRIIEEYLGRKNIPYKVYGGMKFFDRAEIKDVLCFLKYVSNPNDFFAFKRAICLATKGIGQKTIEKMIDGCRGNIVDFIKTQKYAFSKKINEEIKNFIVFMEQLILLFNNMKINKAFDLILEKTNIVNRINDEGEEFSYKLENIYELKNSLLELDNSSTLLNYLDNITLDKSLQEEEDQKSKINLMTIHSAKGLEFEYVFLIGFEDGVFPNQLIANATLDEKEGERRLLYVAITRAKNHLFISYAKEKLVFGKFAYMQPSRFLEDIPNNQIIYKKNIEFEKIL